MKMTRIAAVAAVAGLLVSGLVAEESKLKLGYAGSVVAGYNHSINGQDGSFGVKQALIEVTGQDEANAAKGVVDINVLGSGIDNGLDQAYVEKGFGDLTIKLGQFYTLIGYEVIPVVKNANVSNSLLFAAEPTTHKGLQVNYTIGGLGLAAMVANNAYNNSDLKDYAAQASYKIGDLAMVANYGLSVTKVAAIIENQHLLNFITTYQITDGILVAGEYLYKTQLASDATNAAGNSIAINTQADWAAGKIVKMSPKTQGYSLYTTAKLGELAISPRFSQYFTPEATNQQEQYTLTLKYSFGALKPFVEYNALTDSNKVGGTDNKKDSAQTAMVGASYEF